MMKRHRLLAILLALVMLLGTVVLPASAAPGDLSTKEKADALYRLGLFLGTGTNADGTPNYDLDSQANRAAGATMLIRLLGKENKAIAQYTAKAISAPFNDLGWEAARVAWLYANNLANGVDSTRFGGTQPISAQQFAAFILRALGYNDTGSKPDFNYSQALSYAVRKGVLTQAQSTAYQYEFHREGMVEMCYNALYLKMNDSSLTLLEKLTNDGVFKSSYKDNLSVAGTKAMTLTQKYSGGGMDGLWYPEEQTEGNTLCAADLDGDGKMEVVFGVQSIFCVNGADGKLKWKVAPGSLGNGYTRNNRAPFQILDWDGDGKLEIFAMTFADPRGIVNILDSSGNIERQWTINTGAQVRAAYPADLDGDGKYELIVGLGVGASEAPAVYVYNYDGSIRGGWPQKQGYGLYSNSITTVDLDYDGLQEIILTYDESQIVAFRADGSRVTAAPSFGGVTWDRIFFFANRDLLTYGQDAFATKDSRNSLMGTYSGIVADDLDNNGWKEIVGVTLINNSEVTWDNMNSEAFVNSYAGAAQYFSPYIVNLDRTRYKNTSRGFDWSIVPADTGEIFTLFEENLKKPGTEIKIIDPDYRPVTADVDRDGVKEILYTANDGQVHCFSLDGTEHGAWPFSLNSRTTSVLTYATRPAVADVNGDGKLEVIFATYTPRTQTAVRGSLYVLDYTGKVLAQKTLPPFFMRDSDAGAYANGSNVTPVVADIDRDGKLEIAVMTFSCGLVAYELS